MKKKLLVCVILALLLPGVSPAYAEGGSTRIDALCNLPEIYVTVPATAEVYINPYEIPVEIDGASLDQQIISTPAAIENKSDVPISVAVVVDGAVKAGSDMRLSSVSTKSLDTIAKCAFVYFEMQASSSSSQAVWDSEFDAAKHPIVRYGEGRQINNVAALDQADKPNHFGVFRLTGDCIRTPSPAWTEEDGIDVKIVFTFTPLMRDNT